MLAYIKIDALGSIAPSWNPVLVTFLVPETDRDWIPHSCGLEILIEA